MQRIILLGNDPRLRQKSEPVSLTELKSIEMQNLLDDLESTMVEADGLGLAAPQANIHKNIIVVKVKKSVMCLINPKITELSQEKILDEEGCLSFPGLYGKILRHKTITVEALNKKGEKVKISLSDMDARVVQHEHDHLIGILLTDRLKENATSATVLAKQKS